MTERFTIEVEGSGLASCRPGERVLVALERAQGFGQLKNLPRRLPVGCRRGGCGICRARVLEGAYQTLPMSRAHISAEDENNGFVLACAISPLSDLTLRLEPARLPKAPSLGAAAARPCASTPAPAEAASAAGDLARPCPTAAEITASLNDNKNAAVFGAAVFLEE
ncbi:2Fe-2S iron-sulfur cluster binding domain-containing protein [Pseudoxanthobacter sp.]|uniref:2Fe-2S iron-sulfur cluster binding domain-containing protein n=1 Tax=Pseudoxanthobacter sp. TaxID=1925742 RepID=UPI002FE3E296